MASELHPDGHAVSAPQFSDPDELSLRENPFPLWLAEDLSGRADIGKVHSDKLVPGVAE
jgi:hypothetical protein